MHPLHPLSHPVPSEGSADHSDFTPRADSLLKTLAESLPVKDRPLPLDFGARFPGTRDQLGGKSIFSMGADSRPSVLSAHRRAMAIPIEAAHLPLTLSLG